MLLKISRSTLELDPSLEWNIILRSERLERACSSFFRIPNKKVVKKNEQK